MADVMTMLGSFFKTCLIQICTLIVGGMLIHELCTGEAVTGVRVKKDQERI